ncbi:MAG: sec-independent protein translocase protein TatC [Thermoleophilaceae bacterium]|nr:sec-independent protein translocase protein TatC [Thermoleophilaceae bacterium]
MAKRLKPISHEDQLPLVDHLDELRGRLIVCLVVFGVSLALCFWQNHLILQVLNLPLASIPTLPEGFKPLTLSPTEGFLTTFTVAGYFGIMLALPVLLYQVYAFVLPAFTPSERRVAVPLLLMVPFLFLAGSAFCFFVMLKPALQFLLTFNSSEFNTQLQARDYYSFVAMTMIAMGLLFQLPIAVLAITRLGIVTPEQLRKNRRYAVLVLAIVAALLPTIDPVTMLLEMIPLLLLYELSIWMAVAFGRPAEDLTEPTGADTG